MWVIERRYADGGTGEIIGPFADEGEVKRFAAKFPDYDFYPGHALSIPKGKACLVSVRLTKPEQWDRKWKAK